MSLSMSQNLNTWACTFDRHIKYIYNKASSKMGILRKVRECVDQPTVLRMYKSLVLPHYDYCDTVYMTASKESLNRLQLLQNSACRTMLCTGRDTHIAHMHKNLGLLTLHERRHLHFAFETFKCINTESNKGLQKFFVPIVPVNKCTTRSSKGKNMVVPRASTQMGHKAINVRGPIFLE